MKLNRKDVTRGLVALGVAGALAGGVGIAQAATGTTGSPAASTASASPNRMCGGGMHGMGFGEHAPMDAAAKYLGLSRTDLQSQMHAGKSLADIAKAQGKSVSGLKDAMLAAVESELDDNTTLTAEQRKSKLVQAKSHIDSMVDNAHGTGAGHGPMGMRMGSM
ncbi:hypothetical protein GCM10019016_079400 [Streptomyces prasinosporus]|uniref:Uncharacterized protein n=2 Tax=Streptomyces TaxID=1883 RepID=A0ABP6U2C5_9ACTN|nr:MULTISPECIES: hypothetical protein [Streptomyces]MCG0062729.1 hypothetical protein [Streptomyces tricolor]GHC13863.1 hypothetical protein GCM10010332_49620 [Streptomyces albogriseolus]